MGSLFVPNKTVGLKAIIHPNPSSDIINVEASNGNIINYFEVYNIFGNKLLSIKNKDFKKQIQFNIDNLASGVYLIKIDVKNKGQATTKLIVE